MAVETVENIVFDTVVDHRVDLDQTIEFVELGHDGSFEAFALMKRLVHRIGFRCWAGREAASAPYLEPLVAPFPETGLAILELFGELASDGKTVVIVTHERDARHLVDRTVTIADGCVAP